eukprot:TRINITY_DN23645_c0_g1_i1.p1 TRINITY_DN23645_c0_g1~~TRINITY_DN23645_c0_g1_i1.p1  ORF type:complete len:383 (+),score=78.51 TRINITY_DN23645_c0_g1_i1:98-1150(+)
MLRSLVGSEMCIRDRSHVEAMSNCMHAHALTQVTAATSNAVTHWPRSLAEAESITLAYGQVATATYMHNLTGLDSIPEGMPALELLHMMAMKALAEHFSVPALPTTVEEALELFDCVGSTRWFKSCTKMVEGPATMEQVEVMNRLLVSRGVQRATNNKLKLMPESEQQAQEVLHELKANHADNALKQLSGISNLPPIDEAGVDAMRLGMFTRGFKTFLSRFDHGVMDTNLWDIEVFVEQEHVVVRHLRTEQDNQSGVAFRFPDRGSNFKRRFLISWLVEFTYRRTQGARHLESVRGGIQTVRFSDQMYADAQEQLAGLLAEKYGTRVDRACSSDRNVYDSIANNTYSPPC